MAQWGLLETSMWVNIQRITGEPHCANVVWPDLGAHGLGATPAHPPGPRRSGACALACRAERSIRVSASAWRRWPRSGRHSPAGRQDLTVRIRQHGLPLHPSGIHLPPPIDRRGLPLLYAATDHDAHGRPACRAACPAEGPPSTQPRSFHSLGPGVVYRVTVDMRQQFVDSPLTWRGPVDSSP
jgi:hypothetical protein